MTEKDYEMVTDTLVTHIENGCTQFLKAIDDFKNTKRGRITFEEWCTKYDVDFTYSFWFKSLRLFDVMDSLHARNEHINPVIDGIVLGAVLELDCALADFYFDNIESMIFGRYNETRSALIEMVILEYIDTHLNPLKRRLEFESKLSGETSNMYLEYDIKRFLLKDVALVYCNATSIDIIDLALDLTV